LIPINFAFSLLVGKPKYAWRWSRQLIEGL
jgi:hypothetical protein